MRRSIRLSPDLQIGPFIGDGELVALNVGPDGIIYVVVALRPLDYRIERPGGASFAKTVPAQPQRYRIIGLSESAPVLDHVIDNERFNIHHIQPLHDELLLVCARSHYKSRNNFEKKGRIYTRDGIFTREILLGDGIQSVQTTADDIIWTSYFDEGVFGNFGWHAPVGASGLVAWDAARNKVYESVLQAKRQIDTHNCRTDCQSVLQTKRQIDTHNCRTDCQSVLQTKRQIDTYLYNRTEERSGRSRGVA